MRFELAEEDDEHHFKLFSCYSQSIREPKKMLKRGGQIGKSVYRYV